MRLLTVMAIVPFLLTPISQAAAALPVPPCTAAGATVPTFPALHDPPSILLETDKALINEWVPPACVGWKPKSADIVVALAARTQADSIEVFFERFARVSSLEEITYWSITRQTWRPMLDAAYALSRPDADARRADFSVEEFSAGARLYALHDDNDPVGPLIHKIDIRELSQDRLVLAAVNVGSGRVFGIEVIKPGGFENVTIIERENDDVWRYFTVTRVAARIPNWLKPPSAAYINRVVALYRHLTGVPTDSEPPAARHAGDVAG